MRNSIRYELFPTKGKFKQEFEYISLEPVQTCRAENCAAFADCPYNKMGKCEVEKKYLKAVIDSIVNDMIKKDLTQGILNKVTLHLLPLFHQLCRFQIEAYGVTEVYTMTPRGALVVHPVFKDIRDTIRAIEATQKSMGIDGEYIAALGNLNRNQHGRNAIDTTNHGDGDFRERWRKEAFGKNLGLREPDAGVDAERPQRASLD